MPKIIAVDLDGTLAKTTTDGTIGSPIKAMVDRVNEWHNAGREVVIFTARGDAQYRNIQAWLKNNGMPSLNVTNVKDAEMSEFWDNRAVHVEADTGNVCPGCAKALKKAGNHSAFSSVFSEFTDC